MAKIHATKTLPEIVEDQANKLSCSDFDDGARGLFQESAATAPNEAQLRALPESRGYRIKRHGKRPLFTGAVMLRTYKTGARKGQFQRDKKGRIRTQSSGQPEGEIDRRIRHRGYQAAGWLSARLSKYARGANRKGGANRAEVTLQLTGNNLFVSIVNNSPGAGEVADRTGYLVRAVNARIADLMAGVVKKTTESTQAFNRQKLGNPK